MYLYLSLNERAVANRLFDKNFFRLGQKLINEFPALEYGSAAAILDVSNFIRIFAD